VAGSVSDLSPTWRSGGGRSTSRVTAAAEAIRAIVDRETRAWDAKDVRLLLSVFHPDMVWPWPPDAQAHDPIGWVFVMGRYDYARWSRGWQDLFDTHELIHNRRQIRRIVVTPEGDGGFAVVDVDTLWRDGQGHEQHWKGRACKVYARVGDEWKMTMHTGLLEYPADPTA
jgi:ketosteroid isomerase-like protein